jgi:hypothetical protein
MNIKNIAILIIITAIFAAIAFTLIKKEPQIEKAIVTDSLNFSENDLRKGSADINTFNTDSEVYLILLVKDLKKESNFNIRWIRTESGADEIIQEDSIHTKKEGSGILSLSLSKKDNRYQPGFYTVNITFEDKEPVIKEFNVK